MELLLTNKQADVTAHNNVYLWKGLSDQKLSHETSNLLRTAKTKQWMEIFYRT